MPCDKRFDRSRAHRSPGHQRQQGWHAHSTYRQRIGSSFDDFLDEDGIREEVAARALKEVLAWPIEQEKAAGLTKTAVAHRMPHQPRPTRPRQRLGDPAHPASATACARRHN